MLDRRNESLGATQVASEQLPTNSKWPLESGQASTASDRMLPVSTSILDNQKDVLETVARRAIDAARIIQARAAQLQTPAESRQQAELDRMLQHPQDKATLTQLTDQAFRSQSSGRAVDQLIHILDVQGIPRFFSSMDQTLLQGFQSFGSYLPGVAVPLVKDKMRKETANVILPAETELLRQHLLARRQDGVHMNVNILGDCVLGEREAQHRLETYLAAFQLPEIECVSVKISTLLSQISTIDRAQTLRILSERLELLYLASLRNEYQSRDGSLSSKFLYLDMEEYRDMDLTAAVFMATLDRPSLKHVRAGIALQAYIPDSYLYQQQITRWAQQRVLSGGSPVTVRIVKGANMEMERVEASIRGWPQAPYKSKVETDANYKRMVWFGLKPEHLQAVRVGVASHNLFDISFALELAKEYGVLQHVQFEMLEGMANHQRRALREHCANLLLYAPACKQEDFIHAIGYLVRRLDENTGPENFLRHAFKITVDSPEWSQLEQIFLRSVEMIGNISANPRRTQNRLTEETVVRNMPTALPKCWPPQDAADNLPAFINETDTDFALPHNGAWAQQIVNDWQARCDSRAIEVGLCIDGRDEVGDLTLYESMDPSRPGVVVVRYRAASASQLQRSIECAERDLTGWSQMASEQRYEILRRSAQEIRRRRADLIGAALAEGGKTILESDPEVSEAVDFVEFYARCAGDLQMAPVGSDNLRCNPLGIVVVVSPWNFPIAIPCGGIAAALAAGNRVILKPASDTVLPARIICECFWAGGVPRQALQFVVCSGEAAGKHLLSSPRVDAVILTGGTATAKSMLAARPDMRLYAETGGKNAMIVTSLSDRELAIKHVLHSAFSHSGQKCSATSLLLLEDEVFHDRKFQDSLVDALSSLPVGSAWNLGTRIGPLIRPPSGALLRGLKELEPDETWSLMPHCLDSNPCLYSPGLKWNVRAGSFTHMTELFGPVLGVMPFRNLNQAIQLVHQTGYGLTSGLHSLDDREQELWVERIHAGNLYINRPTTGAIVYRQPFGGFGKSAFGPGIKAGGPNYVVPLMTYPSFTASISTTLPKGVDDVEASSVSGTHPSTFNAAQAAIDEIESVALSTYWNALSDAENPQAMRLRDFLQDAEWLQLSKAVLSYDRFARDEILQTLDAFRLIGQDNLRRYLPLSHVRIRVSLADDLLGVLARIAAGLAADNRVVVSHPPDVQVNFMEILEDLTRDLAGDIEIIEETDERLIKLIQRGQIERLRYASRSAVPLPLRIAANAQFVYIADSPVSPIGRIELLWYVQEQSISVDYHRYGNLGQRANQPRSQTE